MITLTNPLGREKFDGTTVNYDQFEIVNMYLVWDDGNGNKYVKFVANLTSNADTDARAISVRGRILFPKSGETNKSIIETDYDVDTKALSQAHQNQVKGWVDSLKNTVESGLNSIGQVPGTIT